MPGKQIAGILQDIHPIVMKNFYAEHKVDIKPDDSIVTETDRQIEELLIPRLRQIVPGSVIIGEESAPQQADEIERCFQNEYVWAVDPIDGTANFAAGIPHFTVSVGLLKRGPQGFIPVAGGGSFPALSEIYFTHKGRTFLKHAVSGQEKEVQLNIRKGTSSILLPNDLIGQISVDTKNRFISHMRFMGSSAADLIFVSLGKSLAMCSKSHLWDIAGGLAIARTQKLFPRNLISGQIVDAFSIRDFSFDSMKANSHWRLKFPLALSREEYFQDIQELIL